MDNNTIRKIILVVRRTTHTREAIRVTITQAQNDSQVLELPTITLEGIPNVVESGRFAHDLAHALIVAAYFFEEWTKYVDGKR